jgi:hypothetical protein
MYASSTAVAMMELVKFVTCIGVITYESGGKPLKSLYEEIWCKKEEVLKLAVPSLVYTLQVIVDFVRQLYRRLRSFYCFPRIIHFITHCRTWMRPHIK